MAMVNAEKSGKNKTRVVPLTVALTTSLLTSACAGLSDDLTPDFLAGQSEKTKAALDTRSELAKATDYWAKKFAQEPANAEAALAYAKNLKAMGRKRQALAVMQQAIQINPKNPEIASEYGRLALEFGQLNVAQKVLKHADESGQPDWKVASARGAVLARQGNFREAITKFQQALSISNENPSVLNNLAMAHVLSGDPQTAEGYLRRALAVDNSNKKVKKNLALVLGLQGRYDESKKVGSEAQGTRRAAADTEALRKLVRLPAKASQPTHQIAQGTSANQFKPTNTADPQKWDKLIAAAKSAELNLRTTSP